MFEDFMRNAIVEVIVECKQFCKFVIVLCMFMSTDIIFSHYTIHTYVRIVCTLKAHE